MDAADEEWVKAAMTDDIMVVELLVRLHHAAPPPRKPAALPLEWSVRQRRSKSVTVNNHPKKPAHRASPTTPLSWSGATSFSGGGSEESSRPLLLTVSSKTRSKVNIDGEKSASKRSRKRKSLTELKDEESSLLKERRELKRELAALRMNLETQRATNENLKRMKIELQPRMASESTSLAEESVSAQLQQDSPISTTLIPQHNDAVLQPSTSNACPDENATGPKFVLPDLNIPFDEPTSDVICGIS